jgi:hypothetical protein
MFVITVEWIDKYRNENNAWTKAQLTAIGLDFYNLERGWKHKISGSKISLDQKKQFEDGRFLFAGRGKRRPKIKHVASQENGMKLGKLKRIKKPWWVITEHGEPMQACFYRTKCPDNEDEDPVICYYDVAGMEIKINQEDVWAITFNREDCEKEIERVI